MFDIKRDYDAEALVESVENSLARLGYMQLRAVRCHAQKATVRLSGNLSSYHLKQIAQTVAIRVPGVYQVINEIEVNSSARAKSPPRNG